MRALKTASPRNAKPTMMMTTPFNQLYVRPNRSPQLTDYQPNNIPNRPAMKKLPIRTVAISSSTAAVLLVTPVMPKPLSSRYGKSIPAANHLVLVARRARNRQNNHHAGAPANATRIPDMISQAETGREEDLGPVFCTTQPQKNTARSVRRVPATISTVGPHPPSGSIDLRPPLFAGVRLAVHAETSIPPYRHISVARNQGDDSPSYGQVTITRAFNLTPLQSALPRGLAAMKQGDRRNTHIEALV